MAIGILWLRRGNKPPRSRSTSFIVGVLYALLLALPSLWGFPPPAAAQSDATQPQPQPPSPPQPPATQPPAPPPPTAEPVKGETPATVLDDKEVDTLLGKEIRSTTGENMGRVVDVLVNRGGQVRAAIIDFGGFLGVGTRKVAVDWRTIQFAPDGKLDRITLALSRNELRLAPEYKKGEPVVMLGPSTTPPAGPTAPPTTAPPTTDAAPAPPPH